MNFAREEEETLYPSIPKGEFDKTLWNKLVISTFGPEKKYKILTLYAKQTSN